MNCLGKLLLEGNEISKINRNTFECIAFFNKLVLQLSASPPFSFPDIFSVSLVKV